MPPELLESIYHHLHTIDDVHNLGRTHSKIFYIIEIRIVYTEIMRSIIGRSCVHRYDLQLCSIIDLHRKVLEHFGDDGIPSRGTSNQSHQRYKRREESLASTTAVADCPFDPCATCTPDAIVYNILARYQGLRVIENLWPRRQIE